MEVQTKEINKLEEIFRDKYGDFFDLVLSFGIVHEIKSNLKTLEAWGVDVNGVHRSYFHHFCLDQTLNFLDFVGWCVANYSQEERVILDSNQ